MEPDRLGKYEIQGTLGKGAMGTVYAAWDPIISRKVAIKTVRIPDTSDIDAQEELARFKREAQAAGRLTHPNIVGIFDYGETDELAYIVMEFVDGHTLKSMLDAEERMPVAVVARVMADLLAGLQYSHDRGVVHRDIKPANIMITGGAGTGAGQAKIADFGIARIESSNLTQAGTIMGTPSYMSPEQFTGQTVDARTDIYSSGVLLFQLLTGDRPFEGSMATIMHKALNTQPPRPSELSVTAPAALDAVVARAMAKRPDDRYPSASAFEAAMVAAIERRAPVADAFDDEATVIQSATRPEAARNATPSSPRSEAAASERRRSKVPMMAGAAVVVLAVAGGGAWFALSGATAVPPTPARIEGATAQSGNGDASHVEVTPPTMPAPPAETRMPEAPVPITPPSPPTPLPQVTQVVPATSERVAAAEGATPARPPGRGELAAGPKLEPAQIVPPVTTAEVAPPPTQIPREPVVAEAIRPGSTVPPVVLEPVRPPLPAETSKPAAVVAAVAVTPEALRRAVSSAVQGAACSAVRGDVTRAGTLSLQGVIGSGSPVQALLGRIREAAPNAPLDWTVGEATGPYCEVIDAVRAYARPFGASVGGIDIGLRDGREALVADDNIDIRTTTPGFQSYLQIDYFSSDGSVLHVRTAMQGSPVLPARSPQAFVPGTVGPPFGTDLIVAIASSTPLFNKGEALADDAVTYVPALRKAIEAARQRRSELATGAMVVHTAPKS